MLRKFPAICRACASSPRRRASSRRNATIRERRLWNRSRRRGARKFRKLAFHDCGCRTTSQPKTARRARRAIWSECSRCFPIRFRIPPTARFKNTRPRRAFLWRHCRFRLRRAWRSFRRVRRRKPDGSRRSACAGTATPPRECPSHFRRNAF